MALKRANAFGLYDMDGNLSEITDWAGSSDSVHPDRLEVIGSNFENTYEAGGDGASNGFRSVWDWTGTKVRTTGFRVVLDE